MPSMSGPLLVDGVPVFGSPLFMGPGGARLVDQNPNSVFHRSGLGYTTIQAAVDAATANDKIIIAPGEYDEIVSIPVTKSKLTIVGAGGRGSVFIAPSTANARAFTCRGTDVSMFNVGCEGDGTGGGALILGRRFRGISCKFEGGEDALIVGPDAAADVTADGDGDGSDQIYDDCEIAWASNGIVIRGSDYGAVTQARFRRCWSHDCTDHLIDRTGAGATASILFRDLDIWMHRFLRNEDGTAPTSFVDLDTDNTNAGCISECVFAFATNEADVIALSDAVMFVANRTEAGITAARPS